MCDEGEGVRVRRITRRKPTVASVRHPEAGATVTAKSAGPGTAPSIAAGELAGEEERSRGTAALGLAGTLI
jgi:hypothetical protein